MKYVQVVKWASEQEGVHLEMLGEDRNIHHFDLSAECVGVLVAALAIEFEKLNLEGRDQQLIRPTAMQTARTEEGEPMILFTLACGAVLPLVFRTERLGVLISELETITRIDQSSRIRWR